MTVGERDTESPARERHVANFAKVVPASSFALKMGIGRVAGAMLVAHRAGTTDVSRQLMMTMRHATIATS